MFFEIFKYTDINKVEIIYKFNSFTGQNTTRKQQKHSKNATDINTKDNNHIT